MFWDARKKLEVERKRKSKWHPWFAWFPVTLSYPKSYGYTRCWLSKVYRRGTMELWHDGNTIWSYEYAKSLSDVLIDEIKE